MTMTARAKVRIYGLVRVRRIVCDSSLRRASGIRLKTSSAVNKYPEEPTGEDQGYDGQYKRHSRRVIVIALGRNRRVDQHSRRIPGRDGVRKDREDRWLGE